MMDTDIPALIGLLRDRRFKGQEAVRDAAADALEALQARLEDAQKWIDHHYSRTEKAEAALKRKT
jgi:oligoribonuclease NrnB/cAMP/cGMP phosphodiesterase (DHH superfamily)